VTPRLYAVDNLGKAGDSLTRCPQARPPFHHAPPAVPDRPHPGGDNFSGPTQGGEWVIPNSQPLLPLLDISFSTPLHKGWGHSRKDTLR
jgi:hypothetical protein